MSPLVIQALENIKEFGPLRPLISSLLQHCTDHLVTYQASDGQHKIRFQPHEIESGYADELLAAIEQLLADNGLEYVTLEAEAVPPPIAAPSLATRVDARTFRLFRPS